ncbi:MAG: sulfotransferase [Pseudomonadota bacterium]|nr:sulfotransferase [Pseudomonadota bacterium]
MTVTELSLADGFAALNRGDLATAGEACKKALAANQKHVPAHFLVGLVALEGKQRQVAHEAFKSVVTLDRDHAAAWAHLAKLNVGEGRIAAAESALREVRRIQPSDPMVIELTGTVLNSLGEYEAAELFFERAHQMVPQSPSALMNLGNVRVFLGKIDEAVALFKRAIELEPNSAQCHWGLANSEKAKDDSHIKTMQGLIDSGRQSKRSQGFLHYAIGKENEDLGNWADAFSAFTQGAQARRETVEFSEADEAAMFEAIKETYTAEWLASAAPGAEDPAPIFVLGQPRTGTTLIERVITSHSQVYSAGELQQFGLAVRRASRHVDPKRFSKELFLTAATVNPAEIGHMYLRSTAKLRDKSPFFVDKLPVNYLNIPLILAALPKAKIVHLVRDPMDACFASFKQLFADAYLHSYDQCEMARHHARYRDLMAHFRQEFPGHIIDISYEAAARDLEPNARKLIGALELPWEDACLNFHESTSGVATASSVQVREPAHTRSIGRWRRYETELSPMINELTRLGVPLEGVPLD